MADMQTARTTHRSKHEERKRRLAELTFRFAAPSDSGRLSDFLDRTLSKDYFMPRGQVSEMIARRGSHRLLLAQKRGKIIAAGIATDKGRLLNLIVDPKHRNLGIGAELMRLLAPPYVRAKTNMTTGDPTGYYEHQGFTAGEVVESTHGNRVIREMRQCHVIVTCGQSEEAWPVDGARIVLVYPRKGTPARRAGMKKDLASLADCHGASLHEVCIDPDTGGIDELGVGS